jgi:hypothetical protein
VIIKYKPQISELEFRLTGYPTCQGKVHIPIKIASQAFLTFFPSKMNEIDFLSFWDTDLHG